MMDSYFPPSFPMKQVAKSTARTGGSGNNTKGFQE